MPTIQHPRLQRFERLFAVCVFLGFLSYFGLTVFRQVWFEDFGFYLSAVTALQVDLWDPGHETVAGAGLEQAFLYSPYIFSIAALGKVFSLSPFQTLQLAGVLNLVFYCLAIVHFFRVFSINRNCWSAPALFLLVSLIVRRFNFCWSSETSLLTFKWIQSYPSTIAWSVVLVSLAQAESFLSEGKKSHLFAVFLGFWFLLISHMLSASWLFGLLVLRLVFRPLIPAGKDLGTSWMLAVSLVAGLAATPLWPYLDVFKILSLAGHPENPPFGQNLLSEVWYPFLLGLPAMWYFVRRDQHRLFLLWFAGTWFAFLTSKALGLSFGSRYMFFQQFFLHVAIAEVLALGFREAITDGVKAMSRSLRTIMLICIIGVLASPQIHGPHEGPDTLESPVELLRSPPNRQVFESKWGQYRPFLGPSDIILTPPDKSPAYFSSYTGCRSLVGIYRIPFTEERAADVERFLDPRIAWQDKLPILKKHKVSKVLLYPTQKEQRAQLEEHLGPPVFESDDYLVFSVARSLRP